MIRASSLVLILAVAALLAGAGAAAAQCGAPTSVALASGYAAYDVAGGTTGPGLGLDATFPAGAVTMRVAYRHQLLGGQSPDPDGVRVSAAYPTFRLDGLSVCTTGLAGLTRYATLGNTGVSVAGGVGGTVTPAEPGALRPYLTVRGLVGLTTGTILEKQVYAVGLAVGVEAGIEARFGPMVAYLSAARDGLDDGLGVTPFPNTAVQLMVGYRF